MHVLVTFFAVVVVVVLKLQLCVYVDMAAGQVNHCGSLLLVIIELIHYLGKFPTHSLP
jgi:hypothetical protein